MLVLTGAAPRPVSTSIGNPQMWERAHVGFGGTGPPEALLPRNPTWESSHFSGLTTVVVKTSLPVRYGNPCWLVLWHDRAPLGANRSFGTQEAHARTLVLRTHRPATEQERLGIQKIPPTHKKRYLPQCPFTYSPQCSP